MDKRTAVDAFNMLAGEKIGSGIHRDVFVCKIRPELVVKVEIVPDSGYRSFANVDESKFWCANKEYKAISCWLAPVHYTSPDGMILLQERVQPATEADLEKLPKTLPAFLSDRKFGNYGWTRQGAFVCCDYAITNPNPNLKRTKAEWW